MEILIAMSKFMCEERVPFDISQGSYEFKKAAVEPEETANIL